MKKFFTLLLCFALIFGATSSVKVKADNVEPHIVGKDDTYTLKTNLYKGQTVLLPIVPDLIAKGCITDWKIKSGKKYVKIVNSEYIKGIKKGKAVLTGKFGDSKVTLTIRVKKQPKKIQREYEFNGCAFIIPENFVTTTYKDNNLICRSTKDDTAITITHYGENLADDQTQKIKNSLSAMAAESVLIRYGQAGFKIAKADLKQTGDFKYGEFICETPQVDLYFAWKLIEQNGHLFSMLVTSLSEDTVKKIYEAF